MRGGILDLRRNLYQLFGILQLEWLPVMVRVMLKDLSDPDVLHEAKLLMLDISKAKFKLGWEPRMNIEETVALTVDWYRKYKIMNGYDLCVEQINEYVAK